MRRSSPKSPAASETPTETEPRTATMPAGHFVYIPAVLLLGLVIGWILGSRAAADAYAAEARRREERAARKRAQKA